MARRDGLHGDGHPRGAQRAARAAAIRRGLDAASGSIVAIQDADLELDPQQIARLVAPILRGETDVVYGSRFLAGRPDAPWITVAANRVLTGVTNLLFGASLTDMETCYKVMRTPVARSLRLDADRFDIEPQITARLLRARHTHHRAAGALRSPVARAGKEDRLARRGACVGGARRRTAAARCELDIDDGE